MDFEEFESREQKDFEIFMMRYKAQYRDFSKIGDFTYSNELTSIAYDAYLAGQQSKQADIDALKAKIDAIVSIVREADLSDGNSSVAIVHDEIMELLK